jgi:hypothetical protein
VNTTLIQYDVSYLCTVVVQKRVYMRHNTYLHLNQASTLLRSRAFCENCSPTDGRHTFRPGTAGGTTFVYRLIDKLTSAVRPATLRSGAIVPPPHSLPTSTAQVVRSSLNNEVPYYKSYLSGILNSVYLAAGRFVTRRLT